jgi:hypothetical protein
MSDFTSKDHKGLMEAYASIYQQPEQVIEERVDQEIYYENVEIDLDFLVDVVVEHLIAEGYTKTENQALDIIPHISDAWLDNIIESIVIKEHFLDCVNSLVEEGYDLSSYTWDELYENYNSHLTTCLNEVAPALAAAPLAWPAIAAGGTALIGGAAKLLQGMQRQKTDPASQRWLETGSYASKKQTPKQQRDTSQQRRQQAAERLRQKQQAQQTAQKPPAQPAQPSGQPSGSATSGGASSTPPSGPTPPKGPKIDPLQTVKDLFKAGKEFVGKGKGPVSQVLGKPARERFFGTTRAGQITRGATAGGLSALDIGGKIADPSKPSLVSKLGSVGPGATGTVLQGLGNIPGVRGTSLGTGARGAGQAFRQVGREMRDQGKTTPSSSGSQGSTPVIKNGQIVGWK